MSLVRDIVFGEKWPGMNPADSDIRGMMDRECEHVVETHEPLAPENLYLTNSLLPSKKVISLPEDIKPSKNKIGIIYCVVDDKPVLVHKLFAEYYAYALIFQKLAREECVTIFEETTYFQQQK